MKLQRPGNTEINLCFINYIEKYENPSIDEKKKMVGIKNTYVQWLYRTAGYYDKSVNLEQYIISNNLEKYINLLNESIKNSDHLCIAFLNYNNTILHKYVERYINYLNLKKYSNFNIYYMHHLKDYIINKKVLVISSFTELIEQQIFSGNFKTIHGNIFDNTQFIYYKYPYKFFNTGPDNNIFETLDKIKNDIIKLDFDIAILSCGADGTILTNFISENKKDAIYIGGHLPTMFGIFGNRHKEKINDKNFYMNKNITDYNNYIITNIPEKYRPDNYQMIEGGCYW